MESRNNIEKLNSINHQAPLDDGHDLFSPSEKVWENVAKHLPIKKKKRPIIPIFIFGFVFALTSFFIFEANQVTNKNLPSNEPAVASLSTSSNNNVAKSVVSQSTNINSKNNVSKPVDKTITKSISCEKKTTHILSKSNEKRINESKAVKSKSEMPIYATSAIGSHPRNTITSTELLNTQIQAQPKDATSQITNLNYTLIKDSLYSNQDVESRKQFSISPLATLKPMVVIKNISTIDSLALIHQKMISSNQFLYGIAMSISPMSYNSPKVSDPLEGTIKQSAYKNLAQVNAVINRRMSDHVFISIDPGLRFDLLSTSYDLNIPYNYNTEVAFTDKKENYFSHSLPTDLGNIKTNMVVARAIDSPVVHNEKINITFDVNYKTLSLTSPIGVHYSLKNIYEGFYMGVRFVPQYVISRSTDVIKYESHHTYVKSEHVEIYKVSNYKNVYVGGDVQVGYRIPLSLNQVSLDINATYHKNLMNEGRPSDLGLGLSLLSSF